MQQVRLPLIAFVGAVVLFAVALFNRMPPAPPPSPAPTPADIRSTPTPAATHADTAISTQLPPLPAAAALPIAAIPRDDLPTFREALVGTVQRLNPLYAALNPVDADITALIFEGLVRINEFGEPVPHLAANWVISRDALEYVFTLRTDVRWHDGTPFSADDVVYTMSLLSDPAFDGLPEKGAFWRTVETTALNDQTVRFRLTQPLASFLTTLTVGLLPEHALRGTIAADLAAHPFNLTPIGTGPYQLESVIAGDDLRITEVSLRRSANYRARSVGQRLPTIERIRFLLLPDADAAFEALRAGQVDGYLLDRSQRAQALALPGVNTFTTFDPRVGVLIYNWTEPEGTRFFTETRARVALQRALNRAAPVEAHLTTEAVLANSPIMPNSWAYDASLSYPATDSTAALALLQDANIATPTFPPAADGDTSQPIHRFALMVQDDPSLVALAQQIALQWSQLRLEVSIEAVPADEFTQRLADARFDAAIVELPQGADPDPFPHWHVGQNPDGRNWGGMADSRISEVLERARRDPNGLNRVLLYRQFQSLFIERAVAIPLFYPLFTYAVSRRVDGVQLGYISAAADRFRSIGAWTLNDP